MGSNVIEFTHTHTLGVLGGAYGDQALRLTRTHLVFCNGKNQIRVACRQPLDNLADEYSVQSDAELVARPTCNTCGRKFDKLKELGLI
jgi:hypothetical protein